MISGIFEEDKPKTIEEKKSLLLRNRIALWDVIRSCDIVGSSDSSISNVVPNDLSTILSAADIRAIFVNGKAALKYYKKYTEPAIKRPAICLPSTSPANAAWSMEKLLEVWKCIREWESFGPEAGRCHEEYSHGKNAFVPQAANVSVAATPSSPE